MRYSFQDSNFGQKTTQNPYLWILVNIRDELDHFLFAVFVERLVDGDIPDICTMSMM